MFPHAAIYRRALLALIDPDALVRLRAGPEVLVPVTRAPRWVGGRTAFAVAALAEALERLVRPTVQTAFDLGRRDGAVYARTLILQINELAFI